MDDDDEADETVKGGEYWIRMGSSPSYPPRLSYAQLFSFQVLYTNHADSRGYANQGAFGLIGLATSLAKKKGEWKRAILEFDFVMGTMFLQDKDRIVASATLKTYRRTVTGSSGDDNEDDTLLSIRFEEEQWEIMAQNIEEKRAIMHLLECIAKNMSAKEASELGKKNGVVGVDKHVMKSGILIRKAKTAYKDERFVIIVHGKLLLFLSPELVGKRVHYVTSLIGARVQISRSRMEFEVLVPNTKDLVFNSASSMEDFSSWVKVIEASANGDKGAGSDDSDGYNEGRNYGDRFHRLQRGGERRQPRPHEYHDDEMPEGTNRGAAFRNARRSQYAGDNPRRHPTQEDDRSWERIQDSASPYARSPRARPDDASYGQPHNIREDNYDELRPPYGDGSLSYQGVKEGKDHQTARIQDMQAKPQQGYYAEEPYGAVDFTREEGLCGLTKFHDSPARIADAITVLKKEDNWRQKQLKNVNMRRRSVPLQCLDSALDEMTVSIGKMVPFGESQLQGTTTCSNNSDETANIHCLQSSQLNMMEAPIITGFQAYVGFNNGPPLGGGIPLEPLLKDQHEYDDQSAYLLANPTQVQLQGNDPPSFYSSQSSYATLPKQMQSQGIDSSYGNQRSYSTGSKQVQLQGGESPSSYDNICSSKQMQMQRIDAASLHHNQDKQMQLQGNTFSSYISQGSILTGPNQMQPQGSNPPPYVNQSNYLIVPDQMQMPRNETSSASSFFNQSSYFNGPKQTQGVHPSSSNMNTSYGQHVEPIHNMSSAKPIMTRAPGRPVVLSWGGHQHQNTSGWKHEA